MCRVERFCCCCELKTGAIVVTVFTIISVIFFTAIVILTFTDPDSKRLREANEQLHSLGFKQTITNTELWVTRAIWISIAVFGCIIVITLCCAISNNRAGCVLPWLIWSMVTIILIIIGGIMALIQKRWVDGAVSCVQAPIYLYFWICMYSYYLELKGSLHISRHV